LEDTADIVLTNLKVTLVSPGCTPGVFDEEVIFTVFGSISDGKDTVIERGSTSGTSDNTRGVILESRGTSFDSNGNWLFVKSSFHGADIELWNVLITCDGSGSLGCRVYAVSSCQSSS